MEQILEVQMTVPIQIPSDKILVDKLEYQELLEQSDYGSNWKMHDFEKAVGRRYQTLKTKLFDNPKFIKEFSSKNGGFAYLPENSEPYIFKASGAKDFIEHDLWRFL